MLHPAFTPVSRLRGPLRHGAAILLVCAAALAGRPLGSATANAAYLTVFPTIVLTSLVLGAGPGVAGAVVGVLLVEWPLGGDAVSGARVVRAVVIVLTAALVARIASAVRAAHAELQEADRRKSAFLAVLSHELRNPLSAIQNALHVLDHPDVGPDQARRTHRVIERQVHHLTRLVDDLLDLTRISRGKIHLQRSRLDLTDLVRRTVEDHRAIADTHEISLQVRLPSGAPVTADVDPTRIAQAIGNVLQNSAKFTQRGGHVTVALERRAHEAVITVRDDGSGISRELLPHVFEPFTQAEQSLHRRGGGLGLGLSLVKGLVELHGGTVEARSGGPDTGTEIVVVLPVVISDPVVTPARAPSRPGRSGTAKRILVVDDNEDAAETLQQLLSLRGHEVAVAHDGEEGIERARSFRPEVVLCDIGLPGMDGYEVAQAIRSDPALATTLLVALTGYALPDDQRRAAEAGFDRHLAKPVTLEQIDDTLAAIRGAA